MTLSENDYTKILDYIQKDDNDRKDNTPSMNKFDTVDIISKNSISITNGPCLFFTEDSNKIIN